MNILFNSSGIPLLMQSTYIFGETTGTPQKRNEGAYPNPGAI